MDLKEAIRLRIKELIKENNTNANKLSLDCGLSRSTIRKFLKSNRSIKIETITLICQALNISLTEFFNSPLFDDIEVIDY